ncbi:MAG: hypothetical protein JWM87_669 [Candidatus Eremiobacteraeota bacterium]|nr:hypothetical protein [Candidatus Eremiobacteraeota bacterium]
MHDALAVIADYNEAKARDYVPSRPRAPHPGCTVTLTDEHRAALRAALTAEANAFIRERDISNVVHAGRLAALAAQLYVGNVLAIEGGDYHRALGVAAKVPGVREIIVAAGEVAA